MKQVFMTLINRQILFYTLIAAAESCLQLEYCPKLVALSSNTLPQVRNFRITNPKLKNFKFYS